MVGLSVGRKIFRSIFTARKKYGYHPTQKQECLLERIIKASTTEGQLVLYPFMGSGTTGIVCKRLNRKSIGIEKESKYYEICVKRVDC